MATQSQFSELYLPAFLLDFIVLPPETADPTFRTPRLPCLSTDCLCSKDNFQGLHVYIMGLRKSQSPIQARKTWHKLRYSYLIKLLYPSLLMTVESCFVVLLCRSRRSFVNIVNHRQHDSKGTPIPVWTVHSPRTS